MTLTLHQAISAVEYLRDKLEFMAKELPFCDDPKARQALERAASWLGNITNPLPVAEQITWLQECAEEEEAAFYDDHEVGAFRDFLDATSTDEDKRTDLKEFRDELS